VIERQQLYLRVVRNPRRLLRRDVVVLDVVHDCRGAIAAGIARSLL